MKFLIIFIILCLILINIVSALKIGISPAYLDFNGNIHEKICHNFTISTDFNGNIIGKTKWSLINNKTIGNYNLQAENLGIAVDFPKNIQTKKTVINKICITAKEPGSYYGALIYSTENSYAGVGLWINVDINGTNYSNNDKGFGSITGNYINTKENLSSNNKIVYLMFGVSITLLIVLFVILLISYRRRYQL